jgi:hypothetical protein
MQAAKLDIVPASGTADAGITDGGNLPKVGAHGNTTCDIFSAMRATSLISELLEWRCRRK